MTKSWVPTLSRALILGGALFIFAQPSLRADPGAGRGTAPIISSSGQTINVQVESSRSRRSPSTHDSNGRSDRNKRSHDGVIPSISRTSTRRSQSVYLTGNGRFQSYRSGVYIKGYRAEDGFLLPVFGRINRGTSISISSNRSSGGSSTRYLYVRPPNSEDLLRDSYTTNNNTEGTESQPRERVIVIPPPVRTTSLVGTLKQTEEGALEFTADVLNDAPVQYKLIWPERAQKLLTDAGTDKLRVILIGKVNSDDPTPTLRLASAYALSTPAEAE